MFNVKTDELYNKNDVVNSNELRKHIINIDSRFRKTHLETPTDFLYSFAHPYKNVIRARVASVEIPYGFYGFSKTRKQNTIFQIEATDYYGTLQTIQVAIPDGDYSAENLIDEIKKQLNKVREIYGLFFKISLDPISRKTTISHKGSGPVPNPLTPSKEPMSYELVFVMTGFEGRKADFGLGWNLGFCKHIYLVEGGASSPYSLTSESTINTLGDLYFFLGVDDFYTVEQKTNDDYIQCLAKILVKRDTNGIIFDDGYTVLSNDIVFPRPTDLKQVRVKLMDAYGKPLEMNCTNFSFSLEITEIMNVDTYTFYRNYIWDKADPRVNPKLTGSTVPIAPPGKNFN